MMMKFKKLILPILMVLTISHSALGQQNDSTLSQRILMPTLQIGYINNLSNELSGGFIIQTSLEYQTPKGLFFRLNYDTFGSDYELSDVQGTFDILKGSTNFSELLFGMGYRKVIKKHNIFVGVQPGYRFYEYPEIEEAGNILTLKLDERNVTMSRYTIGYEYEIDTRAYLSFEFFGSHIWKKEDFWMNNQWSSGFTVGITSTIF